MRRQPPKAGDRVEFLVENGDSPLRYSGIVQDVLSIQFTVVTDWGGVHYVFFSDPDWRLANG